MKEKKLNLKTIVKRSILLTFNFVLIVVVYLTTTAANFTETTGQIKTRSSCGSTYTYYVNPAIGYNYYESEEDFESNYDYRLDYPGLYDYDYMIEYHEGSPSSQAVYYRDARNSDGWSTWNKPEFIIKYEPINKFLIEELVYTSPPTHLHLCLDYWDDNMDKVASTIFIYRPLIKSWMVSSVESVSNDRGWTDEEKDIYLDNTYTFEKASIFSVNLGSNKNEEEQDFVGDQQIAYGTYKVEINQNSAFEPKTKLKMGIGTKLNYEAEVVSTDWNKIVLRISKTRKNGTVGVADVTIVPN
jgi:hypothetical protein